MRSVALCIGCNYPGTSAALDGCVNDARDWRGVWEARGYDAEVVEEPTAQEFTRLVADRLAMLKPGDRFVLCFSGHGSRQPDLDGDEADGWDETLCLADYASGGVVTDDEMHRLLSIKPHVKRLVVSDTCHSGTVTRVHPDIMRASVNATARYLPPARFLPKRLLGIALKMEADGIIGTRSVPRAGAVLLSGCADNELSYDAWFNGRANGAMSRKAIDALNMPTPFGRAQSLGRWFRDIRRPDVKSVADRVAINALPNQAYPQSPQLTASVWQRVAWKP